LSEDQRRVFEWVREKLEANEVFQVLIEGGPGTGETHLLKEIEKLQKKYGADHIGSDEYFQEIDQTMRKRFPDYFRSHEDDDDPSKNSSDPAEDEPPRRASKPSTPVAPATRSTPPNRVKLKASQVALARKLGITPEQYAKQVAMLERN